jgi:hypothetical protein
MTSSSGKVFDCSRCSWSHSAEGAAVFLALDSSRWPFYINKTILTNGLSPSMASSASMRPQVLNSTFGSASIVTRPGDLGLSRLFLRQILLISLILLTGLILQ